MIRPSSLRAAIAALALVSAFAIGSCSTAPVVIPTDLEARTLVQRAQEAADASKYDLAIRYYQALIDQHGGDPVNHVIADYEIAFITYKQGKEERAKELFSAIIEKYQGPGAAALPPLYKVLSEKILAKLK